MSMNEKIAEAFTKAAESQKASEDHKKWREEEYKARQKAREEETNRLKKLPKSERFGVYYGMIIK